MAKDRIRIRTLNWDRIQIRILSKYPDLKSNFAYNLFYQSYDKGKSLGRILSYLNPDQDLGGFLEDPDTFFLETEIRNSGKGIYRVKFTFIIIAISFISRVDLIADDYLLTLIILW